jgi:iron complex transport system substrate-binding protein
LWIVLASLTGCDEAPDPGADPARISRIVSLAPNLTELIFAAGAAETLVGVSAYSDYPPAARDLPVVGDAFTVDQEQLALLKPDALIVWESGTPAHVVDELRHAGYRVEVIRTRSLGDVGNALLEIGALTGHQDEALQAAKNYEQGLAGLRQRFSSREPISVFYQVSQRPLFTVNGQHFVSELIEVCGGRNIFADLDELAPTINVEAVVDRNPEVMLAGDEAGSDAFAEWGRWPGLAAIRYQNLYFMPADEIGRATPRLLSAGAAVCNALEEARTRRAQAGPIQ